MRSLNPVKILFPNPKAFFFDMDATVIKEESLTLLAEYFDLTDEVAAITERAMAGEIDFGQALSERLILLKGLHISELRKCVSKINYSPGIKVFAERCHLEKIPLFLVSGGFFEFAVTVAKELSVTKFISNQFEIINEKLTGKYILPLVDAAAKKSFLIEICAEYKISPAEVVAVGDGANDIDMALAAGFSVGFQPKQALRKIVNFVNETGDHATMLRLFFHELK